MRSGLWQCSTSKAVQTMSEEKVLSGMRCAIYNRCSTTEEAQNRAIETQAAESVEIVQALGRVICCQYIEQESGTTTKKRTQYASLMADVQQERILKEYIAGPTVAELLRTGRMESGWLEQVRAMCRLLYPAGWNIDYYPTNFIPYNGTLYYIDYECNPYMTEWDFAHWGAQYWTMQPPEG